MGSSESAQKADDEARSEQGIGASSSQGVRLQENSDSSEQSEMRATDMANVEEVLHEVLQNLQSLSDGDDEETSEEDTVGEINFDALMNRLLSWSRRAPGLSSDASNSAEVMQRGISLYERFEQSGVIEEIDEAIECLRSVLSATSNSGTIRTAVLNSLGCAYLSRFERLGELGDLRNTIEYGAETVSLTPDGHADKPGYFNNLGNSYLTRFERLGDVADLNKAIECGAGAVLLTPDGHAVKPSFLNNLGNSYLTRFERLGDVADLNKAIECGADAVSLTPDGHAIKPTFLNNLGNSHVTRLQRLGEVADLNKAIECGADAVSLTPDGHAIKPTFLNNLGISYRTRFERLGDVADLNKAIECGADAVSLTPDGHADKPGYFNNLGISYLTRFERLGDVADLNKAIECGADAVLLTPDGHAVKPTFLNNLGISYATRFERLGEVADLNKAIECGVGAVSLTPNGHAGKPGYFNNLGNLYRTRFKRLGDVADLNKAIECGADAVSLVPDGHADKPAYLNNHGKSYLIRFIQSRQLSDLQFASTAYCAAAESLVGPPSTRLQACLSWAQLAPLHNTFSPHPAYLRAMELLPQVVWIGNTLGQRYSLITKYGDFTTAAAAYAIGTNNLELALEWLEAGRSIVWGQIAQLRAPFELLSTKNTDLANRLKHIGFQLEHAGSQSSAEKSPESNETDLNTEASDHIKLALEWDALLKQARAIPGFEDFLLPAKSTLLLSAAKSHPVAIINVHESRCDALILRPNSNDIYHVPLKDFSATTGHEAREHIASLAGHRGFVRVNQSKSVSLECVLKDLWLGVVNPVLDYLGYTHPADQLPRLTWCTTGALSFLPLHAAGCYDRSQANAFDLVISSYTPTITALLASQSATHQDDCGMLAVGLKHTPGPQFDDLPSVPDELNVVKKHIQSGLYLQLENDKATVARVLEEMGQFSWVHLACHGTQDPANPTQSAFHLHDGRLTLATIAKQSFTGKALAFLSACQTATGHKELPDEAVHLAAGLLMAGYPGVIGTMWSIVDEDGPEVADKVYAGLLKDGAMDRTNSARALHQAVAHLRAKVGEKAIMRWAPFIHIGS